MRMMWYIINLEQYCTTWKLEVNLKKTKIVIFNKQGSLIKKHKFYYKNRLKIENVKEYKYLGFLFTCSGSDNAGTNRLLSQAKEAWFAIQYYLKTSEKQKIHTYLHLFESQVKPIALYACEAWGDSLKEGGNFITNIQSNPVETFHNSVLKRLLGVHKKTTNIALLIETGRHPISLSVKLQAVKYFIRLASTAKGCLLKSPAEDRFLKYIMDTLNKIGMSNIWRKQIINNDCIEKTFVNKIKKRMSDISSQVALNSLKNNHLDNHGKLGFLANIKDVYKEETYLSIDNFQNRKAISKLRTSSHNLEIEAGRWNNTPRGDRICKKCILNEIEDEKHFLFKCHKRKTRILHNTTIPT
jgi:hypothetical protein